jgi:hypothetical protein
VLPNAFLRRCIFDFIDFPDVALMRKIGAFITPGRSSVHAWSLFNVERNCFV